MNNASIAYTSNSLARTRSSGRTSRTPSRPKRRTGSGRPRTSSVPRRSHGPNAAPAASGSVERGEEAAHRDAARRDRAAAWNRTARLGARSKPTSRWPAGRLVRAVQPAAVAHGEPHPVGAAFPPAGASMAPPGSRHTAAAPRRALRRPTCTSSAVTDQIRRRLPGWARPMRPIRTPHQMTPPVAVPARATTRALRACPNRPPAPRPRSRWNNAVASPASTA